MLMYDKGVKEPLTILPKGVMVIFYDRNEKESTTLKGNYAIRYEKSQRMEIRYNVEVINEKGEKLNTERLVWDEQKKKITSNAFVKITTAKEVITGNGLEANQDFTKYEIKKSKLLYIMILKNVSIIKGKEIICFVLNFNKYITVCDCVRNVLLFEQHFN